MTTADLGKMEGAIPGVHCIHLAHDKGQWQSLMNTVINLRLCCVNGARKL